MSILLRFCVNGGVQCILATASGYRKDSTAGVELLRNTRQDRATEPAFAAAWIGESILTWIIMVNMSRNAGNRIIVKLPITVPIRKTATVAASALSMNFKKHNHNK
jgi:hypothetical protein